LKLFFKKKPHSRLNAVKTREINYLYFHDFVFFKT